MKIPWANPWLGKEEKAEVIGAFDSTWLGMGPKVKALEGKMASYIGVRHALAVSNGTVALDLALKAMGISPGDEIIVPAMTYIATVSAILYQHADPVFADIEPETFNIDPASAGKLISKKTKGILYIDYGGNPADHTGLRRVSRTLGVPLIQDGAQSFGGEIGGEKLCKQGVVCTTSFHIAKLITTIEGGMLFTNDDSIALDVIMRRNQGEDPNEKYIHRVLGTNARMTDMQAAIGLRQFEKFAAILEQRARIAGAYYSGFAKSQKIKMPVVRKGAKSAWFFAPILVENRDRVALELNKAGVATRVAYPMPVYEQPFFKTYRSKDRTYDCPNAKYVTERILNLPMYHEMTDEMLDYVIKNVMDITGGN